MTGSMTMQEATLEEMLADPLVRLVMARDGVEEAELRGIVQRVARARAGRPRRDGAARSLADAAA
ncbi:hypothetical protein SAMN06265365_13215 [Tistlia consotensis]|uniref:Uncharacterized protein n=1 Tax=Tistlia consotensis USBA 355 TaxID=560819 RepID=A0A1Y6CN82_9PROT|nr:hypothetical protein [Tistlia consotensis]SMF76077.1 hypothetical protein SAMN05428998_13515 [Tistlia consotensis USBA 355]SNS12188.1 hypothetical protein SAMN06265365_13215 [Tistlia consotensis]